MPTPTLIDDLNEEAAEHAQKIVTCEIVLKAARGKHDEDGAAQLLRYHREKYSRLRAAAERLREEMAKQAKARENAGLGGDERSESIAWACQDALARINGGPLP